MENLNEKKLEEISGGVEGISKKMIPFLHSLSEFFSQITNMNEGQFEAFCADKHITDNKSKALLLYLAGNSKLKKNIW